jgi:uncharacterized protein (DUF305 family)
MRISKTLGALSGVILLIGAVSLAEGQQPGPAPQHGQGMHHGQGAQPVPAPQQRQGSQHDHGAASGQGQSAAAPDSPAIAAFKAANARMHRDMDITFSGNADADFVRGMIPHHQGAIEMAKVLLQYGRDEQTRKWAADIIREQEREIGEMRAWLQRNGG